MADLTGFKRDNYSAYIEKHPTANIQYGIDWTDYLNSGDSISSAVVTIQAISGDAAPLQFPTNAATDVTIAAAVVQFRLEGGTVDNLYNVDVAITTSEGDIDSRRFRIKISNKVL